MHQIRNLKWKIMYLLGQDYEEILVRTEYEANGGQNAVRVAYINNVFT